MDFPAFIKLVESKTGRPMKQYGVRWKGHCPAHDDQSPSFSCWLADDGWICVNCFAGCTTRQIYKALEVEKKDMGPPLRPGMSRTAAARPATPSAPHSANKNGHPGRNKPDYPNARAAVDAVAALLRRQHPEIERTNCFRYCTADAKLYAAVIRFRNPKTFRPIARAADGKWQIGDPPILIWFPYHAERLGNAKTVHVPEGEKCVLALEKYGLVATTSAHGAQCADKTDWKILSGKNIYLWPDRDGPGEGYIFDVWLHLRAICPQIKVVRLPGLPEGGDICDWLKQHKPWTEDEIKAALAEEIDLAKTYPSPPPAPPPDSAEVENT